MKERFYNNTKQRVWCPHCHREVNMPFKNVNIKGKLKLACGCGKGRVVIKPDEEITSEKNEV